MATIALNLTTINTAKQDMKAALASKGVTVTDNFTTYAAGIDSISGGGGTVDTTDYLCFEAKQNGSAISLSNMGGNRPNIEYSFNKSTWTTWNYDDIDLNNGDKVYLRGNNPTGFSVSHPNQGGVFSTFVMTGILYASGSIMSLITKTADPNFASTMTSQFCFGKLFDLCSSLYSAPKLPSTVVKIGCYINMFSACSNLTAAPELPATTLADSCYAFMLSGCSSLREAPYLPATTLLLGCYRYMFYWCSKLQYIKADFTTTPSTSYTNVWVEDVASTGCFIKANNASWTTKGTYACPSGWTLITAVS